MDGAAANYARDVDQAKKGEDRIREILDSEREERRERRKERLASHGSAVQLEDAPVQMTLDVGHALPGDAQGLWSDGVCVDDAEYGGSQSEGSDVDDASEVSDRGLVEDGGDDQSDGDGVIMMDTLREGEEDVGAGEGSVA